MLESVADHGVAATELAHDAGISPATVSHHVSILRKARLLSACRAGKAVRHSVTPLGLALLGGHPAAPSGRLA
ncbi:helix-turn-helix domain-containing protein [Streptomyces muensis]|uniref:helix-turn-helix domain-containing protein n=1 Tax=Streptomyces muensis TaxID=1077944 RepID=UPI003556C188